MSLDLCLKVEKYIGELGKGRCGFEYQIEPDSLGTRIISDFAWSVVATS